MQKIGIFAGALAAFGLFGSHAFAFDFGRRAKVPDWMDPYILSLIAITLFCVVGLSITKPRGVPFKQLPGKKLSLLANVFRFGAAGSAVTAMAMFLIGMGLVRLGGG